MTGAHAVIALAVAAVGPSRAALVVDNAAQLAAGCAAAAACWLTARRLSGPERAWRRMMAYAMSGWTAGQVLWSYHQIVAGRPLPSPTLADVGYLALPVFALPALLALARTAPRRAASERRDAALLVLDGLIVVGSMLILTWMTALGAVVRAGAPTGPAFAVAIAYPVTDLVLVVIVVLIWARPVPRRYRPQLILLGAGLLALAVSDSIFAYLVTAGFGRMPLPADIGFVVGPALIAAAALTRARDRGGVERPRPRGVWPHLLLPYLPMIVTGAVIIARTGAGRPLGTLEAVLAWLGLGLVLARQMITLVDNTVLLGRVSEGQRRLANQAYRDSLTGLANRALFRERLDRIVDGHRADGRKLALLFIDLDDFKLVNDSLGHTIGDRLLRAVASRLHACAGPDGLVARLGGDEFAVLLEGERTEVEVLGAEALGERILAALHAPFAVDAHTLCLGASIGVVTADGADFPVTADGLLRRADLAMYVGKRRGKGMVVRYHAGVTDGSGDPDLPNLLGEALSGDPAAAGFTVHYQPIVRLDDAHVVAVEALARWTHPVAGPVDPDVFVTVAERAGLVAALDDFVLDRGCADAAELAARFGRPIDVHVNVSAARLGRPELEAAVRGALHRHELPPERLVLEITETSRMTDLPAAAAAVRRLRESGVRLALDDFGSGFNALVQLHAVPVDVVKLDGALTVVADDAQPSGRERQAQPSGRERQAQPSGRERQAQPSGRERQAQPSGRERQAEWAEALCRSVLTICGALRVAVVAEGVETASQAVALSRLGCTLGQGYLYGPPQPLGELGPAGRAVTLPVG